MKTNKSSLIVAFLALAVCIFLTNKSYAQSEKFIGKWVITPEMPNNVISHLTILQKGKGFEVSRTKAPEEKWSALFDSKNQKLVAIIDGKMFYFTSDNNTGNLFIFDSETNKKMFELKKE